MNTIFHIIVLALMCQLLNALDIQDYLKDAENLTIIDGKYTYIDLKKDGTYSYALSDNGNTGYFSTGTWKQGDGNIEMIGSWYPMNSFGKNMVKIFKLVIVNLTPIENLKNTFQSFYYFDEIRYQ